MAGADQERVAAIFLTAVHLEGDARRRYVLEACAGDVEALREVEELLAHDRDASPSFLAGGRGEAPHDASGSAPWVIGPYECTRVLGRGGQAVVWLARDRRLGRSVALKVLDRVGPGSEDLVERFKREAAVASGLRHAGICAVHDAGIANGVAFIAMQYVDGETLAQHIARKATAGVPLSNEGVTETLRIVEALARALHVAHEAGIVHRDIKPGNVMIDRDSQPVILDFGLARQDDSDFPTLTRTGNVFGTPAYMSPEQISGAASRLDRRTDIWSLGVTLYEALTFRRPFEAPTPERLYQAILSDTPSSARQHNRAIMRDIDVVIGTAMEKHLPRRYQTALDLAEDLRRVRDHEPIRARPPTPWARITRWTARHPGLAGGLAAAFVILVAGLIVSLSLLARARSEREISQQLAYRSAIAAAASAAALEDPTSLQRHLDDSPPTLRGWEWRYLRSLLDRSIRAISNGREPAGDLGVTPDGKSVILADADGTIETRDLESGSLMRSVRTTPLRGGPWYAPDGRRALVHGRDNRLALWDLESGRELWSFPQEAPLGRAPMTADGSSILIALPDRPGARVLDAASGTPAREFALERIAKDVLWEGDGSPLVATQPWEFDVADAPAGPVRWSGRGSMTRCVARSGRVFTLHRDASGRQAIVGYDAANGREMERHDLPDRKEVWDWDIEPDGAILCAGLDSGAIVIWDRGESAPRDVVLAHARGTIRVKFTPDGRRLLSLGHDGVKVWSPIMNGSPWVVATPGDNHHDLVNSPDGRKLATTRWGDVAMFDVAEGREAWNRWLTHGIVTAMAFDPSSKKLAVATREDLNVLDSGTGEIVATTRRSGTERLAWVGASLVASQPDGAHLIDCESLSETDLLPCPSRVISLASNAATSTFAIGLESGEIRVRGTGGIAPRVLAASSQGPSTALAFSGDGRLLAGGGTSGRVAIWEIETGRQVSTLASAAMPITALVFDPTASAVAGADEGCNVRIWDVASGSERLALRPPVFHAWPGGAWWDERMLRFGDRQNAIVAFETRAPSDGFGRRHLVRTSRAIVNRLFGSGEDTVPAAEVVTRIESDGRIPEEVKRMAIAIARGRGDDLNRLNGYAWEAVLWPDRPARYARALRQASEVCRQRPGDWAFLNTLALAQHRAGEHALALETLARCQSVRRDAGRPAHPGDLVIMAIAEYRLGRIDSARGHLEAARSTFFAPSFGRDEETLQLIREAEVLLGLPASR